MTSAERFRDDRGKTYAVQIAGFRGRDMGETTSARIVPGGLLVSEMARFGDKIAMTATFVPCGEFEAVDFLAANEVKEEWKKDFP